VRVLVTGAGGQLGHDLLAVLQARDGIDATGLAHSELDVADRRSVEDAIAGVRPEVVIHAAAWTAVDACESDPDRAYQVNSLGTRHVVEAARAHGAHACLISTDYVFDGMAGRAYLEWDEPHPLSVYGRSKLWGEREMGPEDTIVRTSWVCGADGSNMLRTVLRMLREGGDRPLRFVDDQWGCPTFTPGLASVVAALALERRPGIYHVTHQGPTTWYGFASEIVAGAGGSRDRVEPISTSDLDPPRPAPRPAYSVLDNAAMRLQGMDLLEDWHDALVRLMVVLHERGEW